MLVFETTLHSLGRVARGSSYSQIAYIFIMGLFFSQCCCCCVGNFAEKEDFWNQTDFQSISAVLKTQSNFGAQYLSKYFLEVSALVS